MVGGVMSSAWPSCVGLLADTDESSVMVSELEADEIEVEVVS